MRNFCHDPAHCGVIGLFHSLIEFCNPQTFDNILLLLGITNRASVILNLDICAVCFFLSHFFIFDFRFAICDLGNRIFLYPIANRQSQIANYKSSSTCFPRKRATSIGSFIRVKPSKVALMTLCGLFEPRIFVLIL
jgi:hypothetical protein